MPNRPLFSILHTSARPDKWRAVYDDWMSKAAHPEDVEYVLCVDERWGFPTEECDDDYDSRLALADEGMRRGVDQVVYNHGRKCYVDGVNTAAKASTGRILIVNADDQFACEGWDDEIRRAMLASTKWEAELDRWPFVVSVSTGTPDEHKRGIMVMPILSRARYESLGYVFFPEYESMYADNDFAAHAQQDGVVIDARHLVFPHRHPLVDSSVKADAAYAAQNRAEAYAAGASLFQRRIACEFGRYPMPDSKVMAICIAGESFSMDWVLALMQLRDNLVRAGWTVVMHSAYTTNVYVTRMLNAKSVLESVGEGMPLPDYVLWFDDDNIVNFADVERLVFDLHARPDVALAAGWCWIVSQHDNTVHVSCGTFSPDGCHLTHFDNLEWAKSRELRKVEWTGFPLVLMRYSLLKELGPEGFLPLLDGRLMFGLAGEDASFCKRAINLGHTLIADPRVKVQHVKPRAIEPIFTDADLPKPKVAAMLRVRNEGRWIERVIESLKPLCGSLIFVMDDESTDDTRAIAVDAGARVFRDPFPGQPLDEARDKNWMTGRVIAECDPDWIFCVDGDEELEPLGTEKIFSVIRNPRALDCYAVKFLYLWDKPNQARFDRWYSTFVRQSLYRASAVAGGLGFKSLYSEAGVDCHSGLHVSNAPGGLETGVLQVYLLHYGYMLKEDRIRKYEYYNRIDPNNPMEDCYRHIVQGDIPEVPASAILMHAGPLELRTLPGSIAPRFELEMPSACSAAD